MNRINKIITFVWRNLFLLAIGILCLTMMTTESVKAYFSDAASNDLGAVLEVGGLFGHLDNPADPDADWGTDDNPYLIYETRHLQNLYSLQNQKDITAINENTVFQVSDTAGNPCFVGGTSWENLFSIPSIGSEDFPFISTFRGVSTTNPTLYTSLPSGQVSDTSVIGNIRVLAYEGQIDIGLFGNVGRPDPNDPDGTNEGIVTTGYIGNLLISNIQISSDTTGDTTKEEHTDYFSSTEDTESNHLGILVGHAQYCTIENISVYYTMTTVYGTPVAELKAFEILANQTDTQYTTAGGIIGYYKQIMVADTEFPVNYNGVDGTGGLYSGFGLGILYSEDIWTYMEEIYGAPMTESTYGLQQTEELNALYANTATLDGLQKTYFSVGVFTFVHSRQAMGEDRIAKLWASDAEEDPSKMWTVSNSGTYSAGTSTVIDSSAKQYTTTQLTTANLSNYGTSYRYPSTTVFPGIDANSYNNTRYRYMIVVESGGVEYAITKNGESLATQKIDTANFVISQDQLIYYTFRVATTIDQYEGQTPDGRERFSYGASKQLRINSTSNYTSYLAQYFLYGKTYPDDETYPDEEERPLRIFTPTSFVYSSATGTTQAATNEYSRLNLSGTGTSTVYALQRYGSSTSGASYYVRFSVGKGFYGYSSAGTSVIKIYVVDTQSATDAVYQKDTYNPTGTTTTYDMSKYVLSYVGQYDSDTATAKYKYDLVTLESLNLPDNLEMPITQIDSVIKMSDPSSYYFLGGTYYGMLKDIPVEGQEGKYVYAPKGSVAVSVNNTGVANDTSSITIIVATDPSQLVDQEITISKFTSTYASGVPVATGSNISGITHVSTFVLPSVPGTSSSVIRTTPISVKQPGDSVYRTAYPNMQTLLVLYTLTVDVSGSKSNPPTTYFLESSKGTANFVYFSVDKTASNLSNPTHSNDAFFEVPNGVDFVFDLLDGTDTKVITVSDAAYVQSLILPYFGLLNESTTETVLVILDAKAFSYSILRYYDTVEEHYMLYINIIAPGDSPPNTYFEIIDQMNFNFYDATYYDTTQGFRVFSDIVIMTINGEEVDWYAYYAS